MPEGVIFNRRASGLVRELSWLDVFIFVVAGPAASGVMFYSVSTAADFPGANLPLAFLFGLIIFLPITLLVAINSATMPRSGGLYIGVSRVLGPTMGFISAWLLFIGYGISSGVLGYLVVGLMGSAFSTAALSSGINWLANLGAAMQTTTWQTIGGFIWVILFWYIAYTGIRKVKNIMRIAFFIPLIGTIISIIWFFSSGGMENVATMFNNTWGAGVFQNIIAKAEALGWQQQAFSFGKTISALIVVIWAYQSITIINYAGGEIKTPKTSMVRGFMIGTVFVGLFYMIIVWAVYSAFGKFIGCYDFLYDNHPETLKALMGSLVQPSVPFYFMAIARNVWFGLIVAITIALWFANSILPGFLANSRLAFALAMDKSFPKALSNVNRRTGSPTNAVHLNAFFCILGVLIMMLSVKIILSILLFTSFFIFWCFGLSAMLLPYHKPEIYDRSPVKWEIFGIPVMTILGGFTFVAGWFFLYLSMENFNIPIMLTLIGVMLAGLIVYLIQQNKNKKEGIDTSKIYSQIPPE
ncbi:MAG: APC family permease [Candidatus Cloacimonetes bacterium]|nr:APC family permease [Candidatus Cloacimonadota bacterium]MCF7814985.1 APC family permease [Candidatus Cloacimonadota bacterium]MCF7868401.1 APC family permease [Candidatus Cloacimonadota bacterium]MCF7883874.1 APC family permease [Candidatus Cloacimonadota bacterium]